MTDQSPSVVWVSPFPPVASGISQYSRDFLAAVDGVWSFRVVAEPGSQPISWRTISAVPASRIGPESVVVYNVGNSGFHPKAFELALKRPGVLVLHDVVLHHARVAAYVRRGKGRDYIQLLKDRYGARGERVAREMLRGVPLDLDDFPFSEDYIEASRIVVVHSAYARSQVLKHCPAAQVHTIPMGVPLHNLSSQQSARVHLNLPDGAYVIASITHVNPMKRLNVVLRALQRVVEHVPEALLIVAGSVSPGMNLERQVSLLGLERHVRIVGYLSDDDSRFLARASDVAVNLRYPSAGETSASLLRLLGAARPVIVTAHGPALELPDNVALKIPVDRFEQETLTEMLVWLANDARARQEFGDAAREFVQNQHSMQASVNGYRTAILDAFGLDLPEPEGGVVVEDEPVVRAREVVPQNPVDLGSSEGRVVEALMGLRLERHDGTIDAVSQALVDLGLNRPGRGRTLPTNGERQIDAELLAVLACPVCKTSVTLEDHELVCGSCGRHYQVEDGIPIMLVDDNEK